MWFNRFLHRSSLGFALILVLFLASRLYKLPSSFFYLNDMGRDSLVLLNWQQTSKPPLLGPQTSALPFNQSAVYFYLLYPLFLLSSGSPFSAVYTLVAFYVAFFCAGFYLVSKQSKTLQMIYLISCLLMVIHPQFIVQNRFVWNPSFVGPLILLAFFLLTKLEKKFSLVTAALYVFCLAFAMSLNYSTFPAVVAFLLLTVFLLKRKGLICWFLFGVMGVLLNLPTLLFEVRHHFLLTSMMLNREKFTQQGTDLSSKIGGFINYCFTTFPAIFQQGLTLFYLAVILIGAIFYLKQKNMTTDQQERKQLFFRALFVLILSVVITFLVPAAVYAHYVFAILVIGIICLASLPAVILMPTALVFISLWSYPILSGHYFTPAVRSVAEMNRCYQVVCQQEKEPLYVSLQSGILPFHNGPEHRYLLKQAGCQVKDIETDPTAANTMAVIVESSEFTYGKTNYNELTNFGPTKELTKYTCQDNLQVITLSRENN
jgi:hypothetical protein